jgi:hypothetical protein
MCANSIGSAQAFLSASDAAVLQEVSDGRISIQSACSLNTRYNRDIMNYNMFDPFKPKTDLINI